MEYVSALIMSFFFVALAPFFIWSLGLFYIFLCGDMIERRQISNKCRAAWKNKDDGWI